MSYQKNKLEKPLCQWPGCDYYSKSRMARGIERYANWLYICRVHVEPFRNCRFDIFEALIWQPRRMRNIKSMKVRRF